MFSAKDLFFTPPATGAYQVTKSLRFRSSASAYMNWTPGSAGNRQKFTISMWIKRGKLGSNTSTWPGLLSARSTGGSGYDDTLVFGDVATGGFQDTFAFLFDGSVAGKVSTTAVYRDPSAWAHYLAAVDTTQSIDANRVKLYVNGVEGPYNSPSYPALNYNCGINNNTAQKLGARDWGGTNEYFDGYLAEVNFIDGQALDPTYFGASDPTTGVWMPKACTVSDYGKNGYYLAFSNITSTTTLGYDTAPIATNHTAANNWTPNNISLTSGTTYDSMLDSPTNYADGGNGRGNYCVMSPIDCATSFTYSSGNLNTDNNAVSGIGRGTIAVSSGKYYFEYTFLSTTGGYPHIGLASVTDATSTTYVGSSSTSWGCRMQGDTATTYAVKRNGGSQVTMGSSGSAIGINDVLMVAFDVTAGKMWFGKNGSWFDSGDPANGTNAEFTNLSGTLAPASSNYGTGALNFGQRPFTYTPPSGFSALNTQNLPTPTILNGASYMAATLYTGSASTQNITISSTNSGNNPLGTSFQPDLVWIKDRTNAQNHKLTDSVRGATKAIQTSNPASETTDTNGVTAFNTNGFSVGTGTRNYSDSNGDSYVAWQWKEGPSYGFDIVTFTQSASAVNHNLGVKPDVLLVFERTGNSGAGGTMTLSAFPTMKDYYLNIATTGTRVNSANVWGGEPTSTQFYMGASVLGSGVTAVAYLWAAISGYSSFGMYTGNGSSDGPFVYTGFRPRWIMLKGNNASNWEMYDTSRDTYNVSNKYLAANSSAVETTTATIDIDILSNGFKLRGSASDMNASGVTFYYMAFAENPFTISRAR